MSVRIVEQKIITLDNGQRVLVVLDENGDYHRVGETVELESRYGRQPDGHIDYELVEKWHGRD